LEKGYGIVITHGNGPQVGNILMRNEAGEQLYNIAQMPLDICVADSQGGIGYMIERQLRNLLTQRNIEKDIVTIVTQVVVDKDSPSMNNPKKRVGMSYDIQEAEVLQEAKGWIFKESSKKPGTYRRVVPSPEPIRIYNTDSIATLAKRGAIVIAVGGGGIPVYMDEHDQLMPVEAVIDKDLASSLLATQIGADELYILTDVPYVYMNYNQPDQEEVEFLDVIDTRKLLEAGQFGEGSMAPKIRAALQFVENGGYKSVITDATKLENKQYGTKITQEYED
jgi:carbamate kinase